MLRRHIVVFPTALYSIPGVWNHLAARFRSFGLLRVAWFWISIFKMRNTARDANEEEDKKISTEEFYECQVYKARNVRGSVYNAMR